MRVREVSKRKKADRKLVVNYRKKSMKRPVEFEVCQGAIGECKCTWDTPWPHVRVEVMR